MSLEYSFRIAGTKIRVCKTMFLNTLDINDSWVKPAFKKLGSGSSVAEDIRGKGNKKSIPPNIIENVKQHINLFPKLPSHYVRKKNKRKYLDESLNIRKMYNFYLEWMSKEKPGEELATQRQYRGVFTGNFDLHFFKPKKDQCDTCFA